MKTKWIVLLVSLLTFEQHFGQYTDVINSNRPGESMSAFAVGKTVIQLESGINYLNEKHAILDYTANGFGMDFNVRYGFFKEQLEAIVELNYQNDTFKNNVNETTRSGLKSTVVGFKYLVYDPFKNYEEKVNIYSWKANHRFKWRQLIPAVSVYAGANLNFSENQFLFNNEISKSISPKAMLITQHIFPNAFVFVTNIFIDKVTTNNQSIGYVMTLTKGFNAKWSGFLENKAIKGDFYADGIGTIGAAYLINKNLQVDASFSKNYKDTPSLTYGGIGVSWRSDARYEDVIIRAKDKSKASDKDKSKKKDKEKDKKKKRLDEVELEKTKP